MTTLPFPLSDEARAERVRECDCPEWAVHCRHFDGRYVRLCVQELVPPQSQPTWSRPFAVDCSLKSICDEHDAWDCGCADIVGLYTTYADALAAFFEAERQLLDGGDA